MSSVSTFLKNKGQLSSTSLYNKVVGDIYGPDYQDSLFVPFSDRTGQARICSEFYDYLLTLPNPMYSLEKRIFKELADERCRTTDAIFEAIEKFVQNNAEQFWNQQHHRSYVEKIQVERQLAGRISEQMELSFYAGAFEGLDDGRKVIQRICGASLATGRDYFFRKVPSKIEETQSKKSLPINVMSEEEWDAKHFKHVKAYKVDLDRLEKAIEAAVMCKSLLFLSDDDDCDDDCDAEDCDAGEGWKDCRKNIQTAVWKALFSAFKLGKHCHFTQGQEAQKSDLGLQFDDWIYYFCEDESEERIVVHNYGFGKRGKRKTSVAFASEVEHIKRRKL